MFLDNPANLTAINEPISPQNLPKRRSSEVCYIFRKWSIKIFLKNLFLFSPARSQKTDPGWTFTVLFTNKTFHI